MTQQLQRWERLVYLAIIAVTLTCLQVTRIELQKWVVLTEDLGHYLLMKTQIDTLKEKLPSLSANDVEFAKSLIRSFGERGNLTPKQAEWVKILIDRADGKDTKAQPKVRVQVGQMTGVIGLFKVASERLNHPRINLTCCGASIILSVAGPGSKAPGSINVAGEGHYGARPWYGRVATDGTWVPTRTLMANQRFFHALTDLLRQFANNPASVAQEHGGLTGRCCFCNSELSDARSTAAGFGPVCADNFGLKDQWKAAVKRMDAAVSAACSGAAAGCV